MTHQTEELRSRSRSRRPSDALLALVVEDDISQQVVLRAALESRGLDVIVTGSGFDALRVLSVQDPQVVLVDLVCPTSTGSSCAVVSAGRTDARSSSSSPPTATRGRWSPRSTPAPNDYVTKPYGPDMLMARVRVGLRHAAALAAMGDETVFRIGDLLVDVQAHLALADGRAIQLSPRQFRLLTALARNAGRVLTHKQLAMVTATDDQVTNADGLRGAMSHLRKRLGRGPRRPRIVTEPHVGYRLIGPDHN